MLDVVIAALGCVLIAAILWDAFETVVLPRRVSRRFRFARLFYRTSWKTYRLPSKRFSSAFRETYLGVFGPLSLLMLLALWAVLLIFGFAMLHWGIGSIVETTGKEANFWTDSYMSGSTFFTLGLGDVAPDSTASRIVAVIEAGAGFGFLALMISYLPVLYQAFSRRETNVSLLDSRAGSPPSAGAFFLRLGDGHRRDRLPFLLEDWESWSADLLESHLSYPVLMYYRSQHEHQSWLAALTVMLDVSALVLTGFQEHADEPAQLTFAISRHAAVDLAQIFGVDPHRAPADRLPHAEFMRLIETVGYKAAPDTEAKLKEMRDLYEPFVAALSEYLMMPLPMWLPEGTEDAWQTTAWDRLMDEVS
ncbi:MAG: potassium channel family protein [Chloroflexota bacterium]